MFPKPKTSIFGPMLLIFAFYFCASIMTLPHYPSIYRDEAFKSVRAYNLFNPSSESFPRLYNFRGGPPNPFPIIGFNAVLGGAYSLIGYDYLVGRYVSLVFGFAVLTFLYLSLTRIGIDRWLSTLLILCVGFTHQFIWSSHVARADIYVCLFVSMATLIMIRNSMRQHPRLLSDFIVGAICGSSVWFYNTGFIVGFAFGLTYFALFLLRQRKGWDKVSLYRFLAYSCAGGLFLVSWYLVNTSFDPVSLLESIDEAHSKFYLQGVPASLHFLAKLGGLFYVPRSLAGYFLGPANRAHLPELLVLIPALALSLRRVWLRNMQEAERVCLLVIGFMMLGFVIAGYIAIYYWILFLPPLMVVIAISAKQVIRRFGRPFLTVSVPLWLCLIVFAQLLLTPYQYNMKEYRSVCKKLESIVNSQNDNRGIMGPIIFQFAFPGRPFTASRDFGAMNKVSGISLEEYCQRFNIGYVVRKVLKDESIWDSKHISKNFTLLGSVGIISRSGSILLPGEKTNTVLYILKLQPTFLSKYLASSSIIKEFLAN